MFNHITHTFLPQSSFYSFNKYLLIVFLSFCTYEQECISNNWSRVLIHLAQKGTPEDRIVNINGKQMSFNANISNMGTKGDLPKGIEADNGEF